MIPSSLEKAILNGWAKYVTRTHAYSSFGEIVMPENVTAIIVSIKWYPFLDPIPFITPGFPFTWKNFFKYNEYQMKIDGETSVNYFHYRNNFQWKWINTNPPAPIDLDSPYDTNMIKHFLLPGQADPVIQSVYLPCQGNIKLTIIRNAFIANIIEIVSAPTQRANEQNAPYGMQDVPALMRGQFISPTPKNFYYFPPGYDAAGNAINSPNRHENYIVDIDKSLSGISKITPNTTPMTSDYPFQCTPLVEFGIVIVDKKYWAKLQNS